jgi:hypothetical protein
MYGWIWRKLPGGRPGKMAGSFVLLVAALALLFFVIFPFAEPRLPFNHVNVDPGGGTPAPAPTVTTTPTTSPTSPTTTPSATALPGD